MHKRILFACFLILCFIRPVTIEAADINSKAGIVSTASGRLNIRATPSTGGTVVGSLSSGSYVTLISKSGSWWKVEYGNGKYGYCHADYIRSVSSTAASVTATSLNVRSGASTSHSITGYLYKGSTALILSTTNGWSRILYHGTKLGYVSAQYLSNGYAPVVLSVPSFKQTDNRWANLTIGTSGKTFSQIGCATTAIAMMESKRTGSVINPREMAEKLTYTPSGSVYWPNNYRVVTDSNRYFEAIYDLLRQGKPVLLGCRDGSGKQHWVVGTGFAGGEKLTASDFIIQDPGSNNRTNLQQFLDIYPVFYKFFYY